RGLRAPGRDGRAGARPHAQRRHHDDGHARHRLRRDRPLTRPSTHRSSTNMNAVSQARRLLSDEAYARIDRELTKYPPEHKRSAAIAALAIAQDEIGWVPREAIEDVARYLGLPPIAIYEVASRSEERRVGERGDEGGGRTRKHA